MGESGRFWHLGKKNYVRIILLTVALLLTGLAIARLFGEVQTSYQARAGRAAASYCNCDAN